MCGSAEASVDSGCSHFGPPIPDPVIPGEGSVILGSLLIPHPHSTLCSLFPNLPGPKKVWLENFIGLSDLKSNMYLLKKKKGKKIVKKCRKV